MGYVYADVMGINSSRRDGGLGTANGKGYAWFRAIQVTVKETGGVEKLSTMN